MARKKKSNTTFFFLKQHDLVWLETKERYGWEIKYGYLPVGKCNMIYTLIIANECNLYICTLMVANYIYLY
jgi:hypothetical protein